VKNSTNEVESPVGKLRTSTAMKRNDVAWHTASSIKTVPIRNPRRGSGAGTGSFPTEEVRSRFKKVNWTFERPGGRSAKRGGFRKVH
jgi:hypothetical protein